MIPALTSPVVFACHCELEAGKIQVGILVFHEDFEPGVHTLYDPLTEQPYPVSIPDLPNPSYTVELDYVSSLQDPPHC
jgi:hypothetical protein